MRIGRSFPARPIIKARVASTSSVAAVYTKARVVNVCTGVGGTGYVRSRVVNACS